MPVHQDFVNQYCKAEQQRLELNATHGPRATSGHSASEADDRARAGAAARDRQSGRGSRRAGARSPRPSCTRRRTATTPACAPRCRFRYQHFVLERAARLAREYFRLEAQTLRFTACATSRWSRRRRRSSRHLQRIPHVDCADAHGTRVHPLPVQGRPGRHRVLPASQHRLRICRRGAQRRLLLAPSEAGAGRPGGARRRSTSIGDTPLYEQVGSQAGVFNRMLIYRRNSLHSGAPTRGLPLRPRILRSGRLSINGFLA